jgi:uncharacterized RDD family membrane protein YckC
MIDSSGSVVYVGFAKRAFARLIDFVLHYLITIAATAAVVFAMYVSGRGHQATASVLERLEHPSWYAFILSILGAVLYGAAFEYLHGSTVGKLLFRIVVLDEELKPCGVLAALVRSFAFLFDSLFLGFVADFAMKQGVKQQRYGDRWAATVVVTRSSAPKTSLRSGFRFAIAFLAACGLDALLSTFDPLSTLF